jgi:hypothetical protein
MEVEVGSFSDPEGLEGLAHFLGEFVLSLSLSLSLSALTPFAGCQHFDSFGSLRARVLIESPSGFVFDSLSEVRIWAS